MNTPWIAQPTTGDVVELILADHRTFEDLLRECRRDDRDRAAARSALAELLVAHAEAEETEVYPTLRAKRTISAHKEEHGEHEHAEILEALLDFLDAKGTTTTKYDDALEELSKVVAHHSGGARESLTAGRCARANGGDRGRGEGQDQGVGARGDREAVRTNGRASALRLSEQLRSLIRRPESADNVMGIIRRGRARDVLDDRPAEEVVGYGPDRLPR